MARPRKELDAILRETLGSSNVYFDPPESFKLQYPCIVYSFTGNNKRFYDNSEYVLTKQYTLIYITRDPDDPKIDLLEALKYCRFDRSYSSDNIWHYAYTIYY